MGDDKRKRNNDPGEIDLCENMDIGFKSIRNAGKATIKKIPQNDT